MRQVLLAAALCSLVVCSCAGNGNKGQPNTVSSPTAPGENEAPFATGFETAWAELTQSADALDLGAQEGDLLSEWKESISSATRDEHDAVARGLRESVLSLGLSSTSETRLLTGLDRAVKSKFHPVFAQLDRGLLEIRARPSSPPTALIWADSKPLSPALVEHWVVKKGLSPNALLGPSSGIFFTRTFSGSYSFDEWKGHVRSNLHIHDSAEDKARHVSFYLCREVGENGSPMIDHVSVGSPFDHGLDSAVYIAYDKDGGDRVAVFQLTKVSSHHFNEHWATAQANRLPLRTHVWFEKDTSQPAFDLSSADGFDAFKTYAKGKLGVGMASNLTIDSIGVCGRDLGVTKTADVAAPVLQDCE